MKTLLQFLGLVFLLFGITIELLMVNVMFPDEVERLIHKFFYWQQWSIAIAMIVGLIVLICLILFLSFIIDKLFGKSPKKKGGYVPYSKRRKF